MEKAQPVTKVDTISVDKVLIETLTLAIEAALGYEKATKGKRKLGITGEVGELLACHQLGLELVCNPNSAGYDAIDRDGACVQIKTRRNETKSLPRETGRTGRFSKHDFNYALLVLLDSNYELCEIWRADYKKLKPMIEKQERRNPSLSSFKNAGKRVFLRHEETKGKD